MRIVSIANRIALTAVLASTSLVSFGQEPSAPPPQQQTTTGTTTLLTVKSRPGEFFEVNATEFQNAPSPGEPRFLGVKITTGLFSPDEMYALKVGDRFTWSDASCGNGCPLLQVWTADGQTLLSNMTSLFYCTSLEKLTCLGVKPSTLKLTRRNIVSKEVKTEMVLGTNRLIAILLNEQVAHKNHRVKGGSLPSNYITVVSQQDMDAAVDIEAKRVQAGIEERERKARYEQQQAEIEKQRRKASYDALMEELEEARQRAALVLAQERIGTVMFCESNPFNPDHGIFMSSVGYRCDLFQRKQGVGLKQILAAGWEIVAETRSPRRENGEINVSLRLKKTSN